MARTSYSKPRVENVQALIAEVKVRKKLRNKDLAELLGISASSFDQRRASPGRFRLEELWILCQLAEAGEDKKTGIL